VTAFDRLDPALQHHIVNSLGWRELRPVQSLAIDAVLDGANVVVLAPTAGGKTEAAFFPVISQVLAEDRRGLSILYVSPIRALLNNQDERLRCYFELVGRRAACWHGDTSQGDRRRILVDPPDCLLTTPESLEALLVSTKSDRRQLFGDVKCVVIDELHAFAGDDRGWHLLSLLSRIQRFARCDLQRIGLSATVGNPQEMLAWLSAGSDRDRQVISPPPSEKLAPDVQLDFVGSLENAAKIIALLHVGEKRLVFCDSRAKVEELTLLLRERNVETFVSHSSLGVDERRQAEHAFAQRQNCVIVATSSLELGLDVGGLDRVIQIDAPGTVSSFLQRMGRTGRRPGVRANCLFLATNDEGFLRAAAVIELWQAGYVEPVRAPAKPYHVLAQQLMALVLQQGGVGRRAWLNWVADVPAFVQMPQETIEEMVSHLIATGVLWSDNEILSFAPHGEAEYGRRHFMDLLSVFTSPPLFRVLFGQKELGSVHESTFYKPEKGPTVLVLAGRAWQTTHLDWNRRLAYVEPAEGRGRSRWIGQGQFLSWELCQAVRRVLAEETNSPLWSQRALAKMRELREGYSWVATDSTALVRDQSGRIEWWTFGGGIANRVLSEHLFGDGRPPSDNLSIGFPAGMTLSEAEEYVRGRLVEKIVPLTLGAAENPLKFSECLTPELAIEVLRARLDATRAVEAISAERMRSVAAA
jgi:ATP-dependent Lhr-like helicase